MSSRASLPQTSIVALMQLSMAALFAHAALPPAPALPIPSANQMAWQKSELLLFAHFGLKTFCQGSCDGPSGSGTGHDNVALFNPADFNAAQWADACKAGGFKGIVITAKHHDGFCIWQTATTGYSVKSTSWKNGQGDVIREVADAFHATGLRFGIYLSAYDLRYGSAEQSAYPTYAQYYNTQLTEVLSNYGRVDEVWFDGYGADNMVIDWATVYQIVTSRQPAAVAFGGSDWPFPDVKSIRVRWPGNEIGNAGDPNWSVIPTPSGSSLTVDPSAVWYPAEADVTLQGSWFYDGGSITSLSQIKNVYLTSVGRNGVGLFNVAPNTQGLIDIASVNRLTIFKSWVDSISLCNMSPGKTATASNVRGNDPAYDGGKAIDADPESYWAPSDGVTACTLTVDLGTSRSIRMFVVQEYVRLGQRVAAHAIQTWNGALWSTAVTAQTIGYKRIHNLSSPVSASKVRLIITQSRACPLINNFGIIGTTSANQTTCNAPEHHATVQEAPGIRIQGGELMVDMPQDGRNDASIGILDMQGRSIVEKANCAAGRMAMPWRDMVHGEYLLKITFRNKTVFKRFALTAVR